MPKENAFLKKLKAQAQANARAEESLKTAAQLEIDLMALLLAAHDICKVGPGRADKLLNSFLAYRIEIAEDIVKEYDEDQQKEVVMAPRNIAFNLQKILGPVGWDKAKTLFPFLRNFWEVGKA